MKKLITILAVAITLISCHKADTQPAPDKNLQKVTGTPRCWTIDYRWKFYYNGTWYNDQEITSLCNLDSAGMALKADTLRAIDLPDYKVTHVSYW